jgi:hypothetical protein
MSFGGSPEFGGGSVPGARGAFESRLDPLNCLSICFWKSGPATGLFRIDGYPYAGREIVDMESVASHARHYGLPA